MNKNKPDDLEDLTLEELMKKVKEQKSEIKVKEQREKRLQMEIERQKKEAFDAFSRNTLKQEAKENFEKNTTYVQSTKDYNSIAAILKWLSVVLFFLCFCVSADAANEKTVKIKEPISYYDKQEYETVEEFNTGLAIAYICLSAISCTLIYAFGELIQIQDDNRNLLKELTKKY